MPSPAAERAKGWSRPGWSRVAWRKVPPTSVLCSEHWRRPQLVDHREQGPALRQVRADRGGPLGLLLAGRAEEGPVVPGQGVRAGGSAVGGQARAVGVQAEQEVPGAVGPQPRGRRRPGGPAPARWAPPTDSLDVRPGHDQRLRCRPAESGEQSAAAVRPGERRRPAAVGQSSGLAPSAERRRRRGRPSGPAGSGPRRA